MPIIPKVIFYVIYILSCFIFEIVSSEDTKLILLNIINRHGERTTEKFYPTDPHRNETFYPVGLGRLTNKGKYVTFKTGERLREEYKNFLGEIYTDEILEARSTYTSRTRMSAQLLLAGLFPPLGEQKWHPSLAWQPIPVNSKPSKYEDLINADCKYKQTLLDKLKENPEVYKNYIAPYLTLFKYIETNSGMKIEDLRHLLDFYFIVSTEDDTGFEQPKWVKNIYPEPLYSTACKAYEYYNLNPEVTKIGSGYLLNKILRDIKLKGNNKLTPIKRKLFLYSGHETTIGWMMNALQIKKKGIPPYSSAFLIEGHQDKNNKIYVKFKFLEDYRKPIIDLRIPGCDLLCPIEKVIELNAEYLPIVTLEEACKEN